MYPLSGAQKAAIVLIALGSEASAAILKHMSEEDVEFATSAIARLDQIPTVQIEAVLEEFHQLTTAQRLYVAGGLDYANKLLVETYGPTLAIQLVDRVVKSMSADSVSFDSFRKVDPQQLARFIQDEHPQTIALILSHLDPSQAATLLGSLPIDTRTHVAIRMADLDQISPEVVRGIAAVIGTKLRNLGELSREACGGVRAVANMFNRLDTNTCSELLDAIEQHDASLLENIRRFMFVFNDLNDLDDMGMKELMVKIDRKVLVVALKGADESLRQKFFKNQSQRAAEMLREDLDILGPVKLKDVDAAQQEIIMLARQLERDGVISLKSSAADKYIY